MMDIEKEHEGRLKKEKRRRNEGYKKKKEGKRKRNVMFYDGFSMRTIMDQM